jgi:hypothetical protein
MAKEASGDTGTFWRIAFIWFGFGFSADTQD